MVTVVKETDLCPCGSGKTYAECCAPYHEGTAWPADAVSMVRARYSAFALGKWQFVLDSEYDEDRESLSLEELKARGEQVSWIRLEIVGSGHSEERNCPYVDFYSYYTIDGVTRELAEHSYFATRDGKLYYTDGEELVREPIRHETPKIGRNDPCPCGSGKKYKKCCGRNA